MNLDSSIVHWKLNVCHMTEQLKRAREGIYFLADLKYTFVGQSYRVKNYRVKKL